MIRTFHISLSPDHRILKITRIVYNDSQPEWWRTLPNAYEVSLLIYPSKTLDVGVLGEVWGRGGYEFWGWQVEGETILPPVSYILLGTVSDSTRAQLINSMTDISSKTSCGLAPLHRSFVLYGRFITGDTKARHCTLLAQFSSQHHFFNRLEISRIARRGVALLGR